MTNIKKEDEDKKVVKELKLAFNDNQKAYNDDIQFSGIKLKQYPKEETWYKELQMKLNKFKKTPEIKGTEKLDVMHPRDYEYVVNNFIALYNGNSNPKMRLIRQGKNQKKYINGRYVEYKAHFFVEFPERKSYHSYEISVQVIRDAKKNKMFKFENGIIDVKFEGVVGLSDVKYGVPNDINKSNNIRFYKDTDKYGNYKFMFNDNEIASILSNRSGRVDAIKESDKSGVKNVPVGTKRNIYQNRFQRGQPPKEPKFVPTKIYTQPSKKEGKLQIAGKCLHKDSFGKIVSRPCNEANMKISYKENRLQSEGKCLSFHADGNIELLKCDNPSNCKPNTDLNNCMDYKFIKFGGLEIDGNNSCLNPSSRNSWIAEKCETSGKADIV